MAMFEGEGSGVGRCEACAESLGRNGAPQRDRVRAATKVGAGRARGCVIMRCVSVILRRRGGARVGHNVQCVSLLRDVPLGGDATSYKRGNLRAHLALGISHGVLV